MEMYKTISEAWYQTCIKCLEKGREYTIDRGSYAGQKRKQLDTLAFIIENPDTRPLGITYGNLQVSNDYEIDKYFREYLITPDLRHNEAYTYAIRIAPYLHDIAEMLRDNPGTNQATLSISQPDDIFLDDPPCLREISWKAIAGKLQMTVFFRSWDLHTCLPTNLGGLQLLNEMISEFAGMEHGRMVCYSDGGHIYDYLWNYFD